MTEAIAKAPSIDFGQFMIRTFRDGPEQIKYRGCLNPPKFDPARIRDMGCEKVVLAICSNLLQIVSMSTPLRLSNELLVEAREAGGRFHRSITQQVEHWAQLGRAIESALSFSTTGKLKDLSKQPDLNSVLAKAETRAGKRKVLAAIKSQKQPVYSADPENPKGVIQSLPNGRTVRGQFVDRKFVPANQS